MIRGTIGLGEVRALEPMWIGGDSAAPGENEEYSSDSLGDDERLANCGWWTWAIWGCRKEPLEAEYEERRSSNGLYFSL